jgi:8-oxo-dGTP diphosphatase
MDQMIVNVEVVVERDGKYLLIIRSDDEEFGAGWVTLPGGKLEPDAAYPSALEQTAQRELAEEVALDVTLDDLRYVESHIFFIDETPVLDVVMHTRNARGEAVAVDPSEVAGVLWLDENEIAAHPGIPEWTRSSLSMAATYVVSQNQ